MTSAAAPWIHHAHGITTVDAEYVRPGFASIHLLERAGRVAIIDTGANSAVPLVLNALSECGLDVTAVDWVFLTHVHLDHAGGVGALLPHLPRARVVVHPRGAPHLIDPARLQAATIAVYGQAAFEHLYGSLLPVPASRVHETHDGERLQLGTSELTILHTPGHALHHQVLFDEDSQAVFTGDTFGLSYRELDTPAGPFILPTTTPTQFDPVQLLASIDRISALEPLAVYLTHYSKVTDVPRLARDLREQVEAFVKLARTHATDANPQASIEGAMRQYLTQRAQHHGVAAAPVAVERVLGPDIELNTQGLVAWLLRSNKS